MPTVSGVGGTIRTTGTFRTPRTPRTPRTFRTFRTFRTNQIPYRSCWIGVGHEAFADQKRAVAGSSQPFEIRARRQAALAHADGLLRNPAGQPVRAIDVHLQRSQVPVVDANETGSAVDGPGQLVLVVHFDQRREPEI